MLISIVRTDLNDLYTIGRMMINGVFECFTLEDKVREVDGQPYASWKIKNETAIPKQRYRVVITESIRFKQDMPLLVGDKEFANNWSGVRIHCGNTAKDTSGCILVGKRVGDGCLEQSRVAYTALFDKIDYAISHGEMVELEIL